MTTRYLDCQFQLKRADNGVSILTSGGVALITATGSPDEATLYDPANGYIALANPISLTYGSGKFAVLDTLGNVDIYIMGPEGDFVVVENVVPGEIAEVLVDYQKRVQQLKLPYSVAQATAATEYDTGFDLPVGAVVQPIGAGLRVHTADATETIDVGLLSSESGGDANGFISLLPVSGSANSTVMAQAAVTVGSNETFFATQTLGALLADFLAGADVAGDVGTNNPKQAVISTATSITYTLTAGTDTAKGWFFLEYVLPQR